MTTEAPGPRDPEDLGASMRPADPENAPATTVGAGGRELLVLVEEPEARSSRGFTGLYHFALLVPRRGDLARWLARAPRMPVMVVPRPAG
jgi:catechol-2,3-dioxygenase